MVTKAKLEQAEALLTIFRESHLGESFDDMDMANKLEDVQPMLKLFEERQLYLFDIFRKAGFFPNENMFSNAVAALLDPKERHGLGTLPLEKLLDMISVKEPKSDAAAIKSRLTQNLPYISVHREKWEEKTIPDIAIIGNDFVIFIENKIRGGKETIINGQAQTERQWQALEQKYKRHNIAILAIFLTPEGKLAVEPHFVALAVNELISCLRDSLIVAMACPARHSIEAFLDFYAWE